MKKHSNIIKDDSLNKFYCIRKKVDHQFPWVKYFSESKNITYVSSIFGAKRYTLDEVVTDFLKIKKEYKEIKFEVIEMEYKIQPIKIKLDVIKGIK